MVSICDDCDSKVELVVDKIINHSGDSYTDSTGSYTLKVKAECECESEKPYCTELDSIEFGGNPPENWM
jgi:hypothetical protein